MLNALATHNCTRLNHSLTGEKLGQFSMNLQGQLTRRSHDQSQRSIVGHAAQYRQWQRQQILTEGHPKGYRLSRSSLGNTNQVPAL